MVVWVSFLIHGTRMVWQPIVESDTNSGGAIRQLVFGGCAAALLFQYFVTRQLDTVLTTGLR